MSRGGFPPCGLVHIVGCAYNLCLFIWDRLASTMALLEAACLLQGSYSQQMRAVSVCEDFLPVARLPVCSSQDGIIESWLQGGRIDRAQLERSAARQAHEMLPSVRPR